MKKEGLPVNIWGGKYCALPNGGTCDACCTTLGIDDKNWGKNGFVKPIGVACPFQGSAKPEFKESGCLIYQFAPNSCENYHCSQSPTRVQLILIDTAQRLELVSAAEAQEAVQRITSSAQP